MNPFQNRTSQYLRCLRSYRFLGIPLLLTWTRFAISSIPLWRTQASAAFRSVPCNSIPAIRVPTLALLASAGRWSVAPCRTVARFAPANVYRFEHLAVLKLGKEAHLCP